MKRALIFAGPAILYLALIFFLSSQSSLPGPSVTGIDKIAHFVEYGVLGALVARALRAYAYEARPQRVVGAAIAISVLFAVSDEIHQGFTPGRSQELADVVADAIGASAGVSLWYAACFFKA